MDKSKVMKSHHDVSSNYALINMTIGDRRFNVAMGKKLEGKANVATREVKKLGTNVIGTKPGLVRYSVALTVYKCTDEFDLALAEYVKTGIMPRVDIQCFNEDPEVSADIGRSVRNFNDCVMDGDIMQAFADIEGGSIEQQINFYAESMEITEHYRNPDYM